MDDRSDEPDSASGCFARSPDITILKKSRNFFCVAVFISNVRNSVWENRIQKEIIVKKTTAFVLVFLLTAFVLIPTSSVMAGGDKNRGEIGEGSTYENGCEDQPCFADAPQPGPTASSESDSSLASELDEKAIESLIFMLKLLTGIK
jgi:hypothetical protein